MAQHKAIGKNLQDIESSLPSGLIRAEERFIKSKPLPNRNTCFINGRCDLLIEFDDRTWGVIDLKITNPKAEDLYKYGRQLHAYKYALENPDQGEPIVVSKMGLLIISPEEVSFHKGFVFFRTKPIWQEVKEDIPGFYKFIDEIADFLSGESPASNPNCGFCNYRDNP